MTETLDRRPLNCTCGWWTEYNNDGDWGGYVRVPDIMCPSWPHPQKFLTPRHRPDKVEPMTTDEPTTRTVYLDNPDIYESDLRQIVAVIDRLKTISDTVGDLFVQRAEIEIWNMNDYPVGTLRLDEDFWVFTPHNESDVEAKVEMVTDDGFTS